MGEVHTPVSVTAMIGYEYLARGPGLASSTDWTRTPDVAYRCAGCGTMTSANDDEYFTCECGSMFVDWDLLGFGSHPGDPNVLVYRRQRLPCPYPVAAGGEPDVGALRADRAEHGPPYGTQAPLDFDE